MAGILTGCATDPIHLPAWEIPEATETATEPLDLPALPELTVNGQTACVNLNGMRALTAYRHVAEANTDIAAENAAALAAQSRAYNELIEAGKLQATIADIREQQLAIARREAFINKLTVLGVLAVGLAASL